MSQWEQPKGLAWCWIFYDSSIRALDVENDYMTFGTPITFGTP